MSQPPSDVRSRANYTLLRYAGRAALLVFATFCMLCIGLQSLAMFAAGPGVFVLAGVLATMTAVPYTLLLIWLDRNEQEPFYLMLTAFLWGALVATAISGIFNSVVGEVATAMVGDYNIGSQLTASFSAPFIEELTKGIAVFFVYILFRNDFDNVLDGMLYGALVGMGFAWFENIAYYVGAGIEGGTGEMLKLAWIRGFLNGVGSHAAYTAITGMGFGLVRVLRKGVLRLFAIPVFWGAAMFAHFLWNTFAGLFILPAGSDAAVLLVSLPIAVAVLEMPFVFLLFIVVVFVWRHENSIIRTYLADEPTDVVTPDDVSRLVPARRRAFELTKKLFTRGPVQWWHQRQLSHRLIRLAFVKWHHAQDDETTWHADQDADVLRLRDRVRKRRARMT